METSPFRPKDVALEVLRRYGGMQSQHLQKVCYYAQCAHLAVAGVPLMTGRFQAGIFGPTHPDIFAALGGGPVSFEDAEVEQEVSWPPEVERVVERCWRMRLSDLVDMARSEVAWRAAREGYGPAERCEVEIDELLMRRRGEHLLGLRYTWPPGGEDALLAEISERHARDDAEFERSRLRSSTFDYWDPSVDKEDLHQDREALIRMARALIEERRGLLASLPPS